MNKRTRTGLFSLITLWVVLISLVMPLAALADDATPPADEQTVQESVDPGTGGGLTEENPVPADETAATEEPAATDETAATETAAPVETGLTGEESTAAEVTVADALEAAPEGTELVVLDENGEALPLASEEAAQIVAVVDPMWCPENITPGGAGCTAPYSSLQALLDYLANDLNEPSVNGVIWIEADYDSSVNDSVNGFTLQGSGAFSTMSLYDLTIQGGWSGDNDMVVDHNDPSEFYGDRLRILNWTGDVTVNDVFINSADDTGLVITSSGEVNLNYVESSDNLGRGARINNDSGSGDVNISNSQFNNNYDYNGTPGTGLRVVSDGNLTLTNVTANYNDDRGAALFTSGTVSVDPSEFDENGQEGLYIEAGSDVELTDVTAHENGLTGFSVYADGNLTLLNLAASLNGAAGAEFENSGNLTLTNGVFNINGFGCGGETCYDSTGYFSDGLDIFTDGSVELNSISAEGNFEYGASIFGNGVEINTGQFDENYQIGLYVNDGALTTLILNYVSANDNGWTGAGLFSDGMIQITGSQFNGNGWDAQLQCPGSIGTNCYYSLPSVWWDVPYGVGLWAFSWDGPINLDDVQANENYGHGSVLLSNEINVQDSFFNNNGIVTLDNLDEYCGANDELCDFVDTTCALETDFNACWQSFIDIVLYGEGFEGISYNLYADGLFASDISSSSAMVQCSEANNNAAYGVEIYSGDVTVQNVSPSGNGWSNTLTDSVYGYNSLTIFEGNCETTTTGGGGGGGGADPIIPVTGGEGFPIECNNPEVFTALMEDDDRVLFSLLCGYDGVLVELPSDTLPGNLPAGTEFLASHTVAVLDEGNPVTPLPEGASITLQFQVEDEDAEYAILFWNGSEWVEVEGVLEDGYFQAEVDYTGTFVLVMK